MMTIHMKRASLEDIEELMNWRMEVLSEVFSDCKEEIISELYQANYDYYKDAHDKDSHIAVFAEVDNVTVGCGGICIYQEMPSPDNRNGLCAYLMNIYTRKEYRGLGIARQIVRYLIEQAHDRGIQKIYLETTDSGRMLYEHVGFEEMTGYMKLGNGENK